MRGLRDGDVSTSGEDGSATGSRRRKRWALCLALVGLGLAGAVAPFVIPLPERLVAPPSRVVTFADGSRAQVFLTPDGRYRMPVRLAEVDPDYLRALLRFEDKRFYRHPGVDPIAVLRAAYLNLRCRRVVSGASTITMQLIRLLEPRPRTLTSKAIEALRALQLELRLSKQEILAAYLTFTSYGRNLEGIRVASFAYFGHGVEELSPEEVATLLAISQRPSARYPSPENQERLAEARDHIAAWLLEHDALSWETTPGWRREPEPAGVVPASLSRATAVFSLTASLSLPVLRLPEPTQPPRP